MRKDNGLKKDVILVNCNLEVDGSKCYTVSCPRKGEIRSLQAPGDISKMNHISLYDKQGNCTAYTATGYGTEYSPPNGVPMYSYTNYTSSGNVCKSNPPLDTAEITTNIGVVKGDPGSKYR